ncbi:hypothetical protein [Pareuzebyella sediminis]|uniref:hypothetical protein n=1 Tax=Pareuzebyella sediminis TaxID=2607998 RepID=UPI0011ED3A03|nr:hypothetical protein [Pareuzebyella sediminis]
MKIVTLLVIVVLLGSSCKEKAEKSDVTSSQSQKTEKFEDSDAMLQLGCYRYEEDGNTIQLDITKVGEKVKGKLVYQLSEKDRNTGIFEGTLADNKLVGTYTFDSEGVESTREVAFMVKGGALVEGYGELNNEGTAFKDYNAIRFSSTMPLRKTKCE